MKTRFFEVIMGYYGNRELVKRARVLRSNLTIPERILWSRLRSKQVDGYKFRRQEPIYDYIVDFYCHELNLIIEVDGEIHALAENKEYDKKREKILIINGYHMLRFSNVEIETEIENAVIKIKSYIKTILDSSRKESLESQL
jgi:very-short-patch-repair endonuclease